MFKQVGRAAYVEVNLDSLTHNIGVIRKCCTNPKTGIIGVVKAGAYGHGSVAVSKHLKSIGVERLAIATVDEGVHLRKAGITGVIHVLGNVLSLEMEECIRHNLTPTITTIEAAEGVALAVQNNKQAIEETFDSNSSDMLRPGSVNIKVDSGMSRNGCQPKELAAIVQKCDDEGVHIDGMFTHFADSWGDKDFTENQLNTFVSTIKPYRSRPGLHFHVANTGAILTGVGVDLDFIRPGISMYGLPPDDASERFKAFGLRPLAAIKAVPTLVKRLSAGRLVGYSMSYETKCDEWIGTFPVGYADGFWRHLSSLKDNQPKGFIVRDRTGEKCDIIGRVSMDAITVRLPCQPDADEIFTLMTSDYDLDTSACGIASKTGTISYEVGTRLSLRFSRVYITNSSCEIIHALSATCY